MNKPDISKYGYVSSNSFEEESGWTIEGGEEAYYEALNKYNEEKQVHELLQEYFDNTDKKEIVKTWKQFNKEQDKKEHKTK